MSNILLRSFKARRNELGITQKEMARRLNISQSQYQKIESDGNPTLKILTSMAMALNMKIMLVPLEKSSEICELLEPTIDDHKSLLEKFEIKEDE